jgi:hypothetical protein
MSFLTYHEDWQSRRAEKTTSGRRYWRSWVFTASTTGSGITIEDDPNESDILQQFGSQPDLPTIRASVHPNDSAAYAVEVQVEPRDGQPHVWNAVVQYETARGATVPEEVSTEDPLDRPAEIEWSFIQREYVLEIDKSAPPLYVVNSANEPFDPPLIEQDIIPVVRITRNQENFYYGAIKTYVNKVNSSTFWSDWPAGTVLMSSITANQLVEGGVLYWRVTYELQLRIDGWQLDVMDRGFRQLVDGKPQVITDENGEPFNTPQCLDLSGHLLPPTQDPEYMTFYPKAEVDFGPLDL